MRVFSFRHSPNPLKVRLALAELDLPCEITEINLFKGEHRTPEFAKVNPFHKVPVLEDGELRLRESNAILAYLGREYGGKLWPRHPQREAEALRALFFESVHLVRECGTVWWTDHIAVFARRTGANDYALASAVDELETMLDKLQHELGDEYLLGDFTLADCSLGVTLNTLRGTRVDLDRFPKVKAYCDRVRARVSWKKAEGDAIYPSLSEET